MIEKALIGFACLLIALGSCFISWSFRSPSRKNNRRKLLQVGGLGVIVALIGGLILILFYYSEQPVPERIIEEHLEEDYPSKPLDVSMQNNLQNKGIT
jgi:hypothetical protein